MRKPRAGREGAPPASPFDVPAVPHALGSLVERFGAFWRRLGRLESALLADRLERVSVRMPIFVCGLARSGSTLLHEVVASHPGVATHRVRDFPMVLTPYWWRRATARLPPALPRERAHGDGVLITTDSPDALEEPVWMAFFPRCHDPGVSNVLGAGARHPAFEAFYRAHVGKLLLAEGATRYAAKANYHVARLAYLARIFPDPKFLIPVRSPADHVASLRQQHRWFSRGQRAYPRALAYMRRSGHFEFGLDRRPMHLGDAGRVRRVRDAWAAGDEVLGLAVYWDMVHRYLADLLESDPAVRAAAHVVRYEDVRASPAEALRAALDHCKLPGAEAVVAQQAARVRGPTSSSAALLQAERDVIRAETQATAGRWGY